MHWTKRSFSPTLYTNVASSYISICHIYQYHYITDLLYISAFHVLFLNGALRGPNQMAPLILLSNGLVAYPVGRRFMKNIPFDLHTIFCVMFYCAILAGSYDSFTHILQGSFTGTVTTYQSCSYPEELQWRHNERGVVSNQKPHDFLLNCLFKRRSNKTSKLRVTGLCEGNSPGPVNSPHKGPVTRKMFPLDDVSMGYVSDPLLPSHNKIQVWTMCIIIGLCRIL